MSNTQLIIPKKLKAGFNLRDDTYSGKLAYVIYNDGKTWRKEKSWESWSEKEYKNAYGEKTPKLNPNWEKVKPIEFDNEPMSGFVLNKKVGGGRSDWNHRATYCRVFDPRGFEFEISIPNLLFILQETNSIKGKGLEGEFVYSWDGKDLVLLPCDSIDYQKSQEFTKLQTQKISAKTLIVGATYLTKKQENVVYLGKLDYYDHKMSYDKEERTSGIVFYRSFELVSESYTYNEISKKMFVFYNLENKKLIYQSGISFLGACIDDKCSPDYVTYLEMYENSYEANRIVKVEFEKMTLDDFIPNDSWYEKGWVAESIRCCYAVEPNTDQPMIRQSDGYYGFAIKDGLIETYRLYQYSPKKWNFVYTDTSLCVQKTILPNDLLSKTPESYKYKTLQELIDGENLCQLIAISATGKRIKTSKIY